MKSYEELLTLYNNILEENRKLKSENTELKRWLGITEPSVIPPALPEPAVTKHSSPQEKITLFRSLFHGREDVFARRWYSEKTGKSGYQPVCGNEWAVGICDKRKYKCSVCPNRSLMPLTDHDIFSHLAGKDELCRDVVGIYPLLKDETCCFTAIDFDGTSFREDAAAVMKICEQYGIPAYTEISRSGNGVHLWIFFEEPIPASTARKLASGLLTKAMESTPGISFSSYDRIFPNQDTMPDGGFGNLIALPLQGKARAEGRSVFVDTNFRPYDDQWAFLSRIRKISAVTVTEKVKVLCKNGDLGTLITDSYEKPWETKKDTALSIEDFPSEITIIRSNMLYIFRKGLSALAQNRLKRLAAFQNPDFYRSQAMRLPIYNKPRVICTADITDKYIGLPRGCEDALCKLLTDCKVTYHVDDKTNPGTDISVNFNGTLREEQQSASEALLLHNIGVLSATTAFGKTVVASYLIGQRKTNTLILVHTRSLMMQWKKSLETFLDLDITPVMTKKGTVKKNWSPVGLLGAGKNGVGGYVDVAVMQSLVQGDTVKELVRNYGMVIVDECHHVSAVNFEKILRYANAKYVYGLTATPQRQDGQHPIIFMQCGPIRYRVDAKEQAEKRGFEHILIPRFTDFRCANLGRSIAALYKDLAESKSRNEQIISDVKNALLENRCPIILTERREHVQLLADKLADACPIIIKLTGTASQKERQETMNQLHSIPEDEPLVIIATGKYVGEGFDYPRLDTLFLALPIAWKGKVAQYAGRLHRNYAGKTEVQVYDYVDLHIPVLEKMYQKRLKGYASIGYKIKGSSTPSSAPDLIYDGKSYLPAYEQDLQNVKKEILIVSPYLQSGRIKQFIKLISPAVLRQVSIVVMTRPTGEYKEKDRISAENNLRTLREYGITVTEKSGISARFCVIDQKTVWYGSVNFLGFSSEEDSVMRLADEEIAGRLLDTVIGKN